MTPVYADPWLTIYGGDCREVMAAMEPESVHCVVTSPPYWGLRDYGTAAWVGGDEGCDHLGEPKRTQAGFNERYFGKPSVEDKQGELRVPYRDACGKCGAIRQDRQLGLEPTPEEYVANMVAVFREVRRVLRADGTVWLNLGDSYAGSWGNQGRKPERGTQRPINGEMLTPVHDGRYPSKESNTGDVPPGLKPKDLVGIPWRVAFALQADGWYLRSDIIWSKPNPMPESVTDRPTKSHEYLFLLAKSPRYYFDADAVREVVSPASDFTPRGPVEVTGQLNPSGLKRQSARLGNGSVGDPAGRNVRSVWTIATQPYGAHFAVFPEKLVEPCILAGSSERGVCPECGAPWVRTFERVDNGRRGKMADGWDTEPGGHGTIHRNGRSKGEPDRVLYDNVTTGWRPSCAHISPLPPAGAVILDPFAGSGTVGRVANRLSRRAVLIDLNPEYLRQQMERNRDIPLGLGA